MAENSKDLTGFVHSLESFGSVDGPGVRYVIFFSGCFMRCQFCHNPDTWNMQAGSRYTVEELLKTALKYQVYWGEKGGITVSGGEPLLQIDFLTELFRSAKEKGIHTALDTSGSPFTREPPFFDKLQRLMRYTDLVMLDLKHIEEKRHRELTGHTNRNILDMARYLSEIKKSVWIRHVLVPERSDYDEDLMNLQKFISTLDNVEKIEVLPYHTLGAYKWTKMGMAYPLEGIRPPTAGRIENAERILQRVIHEKKVSDYSNENHTSV